MPRARAAEPKPSSERPTLRVESNIIEEHALAADALAEIRRHLDESHHLEQTARNEALISAATLRANAIRRSDIHQINGDRAWELIHELHAYEYDLEDALERSSDDELTHALEAVRTTLDQIRPMTNHIPERVRSEDPEADHAEHALWEDAREARQALAEGTLDPEEAARLKTVFIERAQRLEDDELMLEQASQDSGLRRHPEKQASMVRALGELHTAIAELGEQEIVKAMAEQPVVVTESDFVPEPHVAELQKIAKQQRALANQVMEKYGQGPQELFESGGPKGFLHGLRRLVSNDLDQTKDPYEKWKKLEERRQVIEAVRNPPPARKEAIPIPLKRRKMKRAA